MLNYQLGPVELSETNGVVSLKAELPPVGGGALAGIVSGAVVLNVSALQLLDAGLALAGEKFPALAPEIALIKSALDAEAAKL